MFRRLLLGSFSLLAAAAPVCAGDPGGSPGAEWLHADLQRLPRVEELPLPIEKAESGEEAGSGEEPPGGEEALPATGDASAEPSLEEPQLEEPPAEGTFGAMEAEVELWEGRFELGLDGTEGNSQTLNFRLGFDAERTTPDNALTFDFDYRKSRTDGDETVHRAFLDWRYERLFHESPWTCFVHGTVDYDELTTFDVRVTTDLGLGYRLIETESTSLAARFGSGFSHEIGSTDTSYVPEAVFGLDFEHQLNKRQKLTASVEHTPDLTNFGESRITSRVGWEVIIDREMNLSLKLSVMDRYDSTPNGAKANDLDYAAVLLWQF